MPRRSGPARGDLLFCRLPLLPIRGKPGLHQGTVLCHHPLSPCRGKVVVACNTAGGFERPGMLSRGPLCRGNPRKRAALHTKTAGWVLATALTLPGTVSPTWERFANGLTVVTQPSPGLVEAVEAGRWRQKRPESCSCIQPLLDHDVDVIVLGCTHYPFLRPLVEKIAGPEIKVLDTGKPVARQVMRVLERRGLLSPRQEGGKESFFTSGLPERVAPVLRRLWPRPVPEVIPVDE